MDKELEKLLSRPTITVDEAAEVLSDSAAMGPTSAWAGDVASVSMGRRRLVLTAPLRRMLAIEAAA